MAASHGKGDPKAGMLGAPGAEGKAPGKGGLCAGTLMTPVEVLYKNPGTRDDEFKPPAANWTIAG